METESSIWILSSILHQVASIVYRRRKGPGNMQTVISQ